MRIIKDAVINFTVGAGGLGGATNANGTAGADTTLNSITPDGGTAVDLSGPSAPGGIPTSSAVPFTVEAEDVNVEDSLFLEEIKKNLNLGV